MDTTESLMFWKSDFSPWCIPPPLFPTHRVHTMSLPVVSELSDLYNGADAAALACISGKLAVEKLLVSPLEETRQTLQTKVWVQEGFMAISIQCVFWGAVSSNIFMLPARSFMCFICFSFYPSNPTFSWCLCWKSSAQSTQRACASQTCSSIHPLFGNFQSGLWEPCVAQHWGVMMKTDWL